MPHPTQSVEAVEPSVLTIDQVAAMTGLSKSTLYKMTSARKIKHSKPTARVLYFKRSDVEEWMLSNPIATDEELEVRAANYNVTRGAA